MAARFDLDPIGVGLSWEQEVSYTRRNGTGFDPIDLTGWATTMRFRDASGVVKVTLTEAASGYGTIVNGTTDGSIAVALSAAGSALLVVGRGTFEIDIQNSSGFVHRLLDGYVPVVAPGGRVVMAARNVTVVKRQDIQIVEIEETIAIRVVERSSLFGGVANGASGASTAYVDASSAAVEALFSTGAYNGSVPVWNGTAFDHVGSIQQRITADADTTKQPFVDNFGVYRLETSQLTANRVFTVDDTGVTSKPNLGANARISVIIVGSGSGFSWSIENLSGTELQPATAGLEQDVDLMYDGQFLINVGVGYK